MKRITLAAALLAASTTAYAADLPSRRAPPVFVPPPVPVFSWTGFYAGGQVGYAFGKDTLTGFTNGVPTAIGAVNAPKPNGLIGGAHIGYNFALPGLGGGLFGGGLVFGVEGDINGTDYRGAGGIGAVATTTRVQIDGSARGRVGIAVDRALFYVTGGAAFTQFNNTYNNGAAFDTLTSTKVGYTVGGGIEYAITTNWSLRAEYRYSDFGRVTHPLPNISAGVGAALAVSNRLTQNRVQLGFSYKFADPIAPVVARY